MVRPLQTSVTNMHMLQDSGTYSSIHYPQTPR
jgi:hypothetical protein